MTYKEIVDRALEECNYDFTTTTTVPRTRFKKRVNDWHRRLLTRPGFTRLLRDNSLYTFASVASQPVYGLPLALGRVNAITEGDNDQRLEMRTLDWLRSADPGLTASGTPDVYVLRGWSQVQVQPSNASAITIKSTSASDTGTAKIEYLNAAGQRLLGSVTMGGTVDTTVVASGVVEITSCYLSAAAVGTVTLYEDSAAGTALAVIPVGYTSARYLHIQLWPTPTSAITYSVDYSRELADLVQDMETPLLPPDFHHILWRGAVVDEWVFKNDLERADYARTDLENELRHLHHWLWNQVDYRPSPGDQPAQMSRLGSWFPAGT